MLLLKKIFQQTLFLGKNWVCTFDSAIKISGASFESVCMRDDGAAGERRRWGWVWGWLAAALFRLWSINVTWHTAQQTNSRYRRLWWTITFRLIPHRNHWQTTFFICTIKSHLPRGAAEKTCACPYVRPLAFIYPMAHSHAHYVKCLIN
jgi:hypothetical protein